MTRLLVTDVSPAGVAIGGAAVSVRNATPIPRSSAMSRTCTIPEKTGLLLGAWLLTVGMPSNTTAIEREMALTPDLSPHRRRQRQRPVILDRLPPAGPHLRHEVELDRLPAPTRAPERRGPSVFSLPDEVRRARH